MHVGACLEVSHTQPQFSAILTVRVTACQMYLCCEVSKELLDLEQRSVVKFLTKEGKKPKEILEHMVVVYGSLPLLTTK